MIYINLLICCAILIASLLPFTNGHGSTIDEIIDGLTFTTAEFRIPEDYKDVTSILLDQTRRDEGYIDDASQTFGPTKSTWFNSSLTSGTGTNFAKSTVATTASTDDIDLNLELTTQLSTSKIVKLETGETKESYASRRQDGHSTYFPSLITKKDNTKSTPIVAAVYEDLPDDVLDHHQVSYVSKGGGNPILVQDLQNDKQEICDFCIYEGEGNFTSYGYPLRYRPNLNCSYRIQRLDDRDVCELEVVFHDFDVPVSSAPGSTSELSQSNDCREDYLEVHGRRFCGGGWREQSEIIPFPPTQKEVTFYFKSNERVSGRGFWVEVKRRPGTCFSKRPLKTCEERFSETEFQIMSPRFPSDYPNNADCTYYIRRTSNDICGLEMTFLHFDVESVNGCHYDYFEMDGQKLCGIIARNTVRLFNFNEDQKVIVFHTDKQVPRSGFHVRVRQMSQCQPSLQLPPPPSCNICTNEKTGTLVSYSYPHHYRNNQLCSYTIDKADPDYCAVELHFEDFNIDPSIDCIEDYLQVGGKRYCGTTLHSSKKILGFAKDNSLLMVFKTDAGRTSKGFSLKYKQLPCSRDALIPTTSSSSPPKIPIVPGDNHMCDYVYGDKNFAIRSENFSSNYPNNMDCNYFIKRNNSRVCYLELTFLKFDVEASPQCQFDYFEVNFVRLCGSLQKETTRTYIFDSDEKILKFHSDASTSRTGYLIKADQLECKGDAIIRGQSTEPNTPHLSCDEVYTESDFEIRSPGYSRPYAGNSNCMYMIKKSGPNVCRLEVTYYDFEVQLSDQNGYCKYDYLDFNGIRVCGIIPKGAARTYYFPGNDFPIRFQSDGSITHSDRGFRIGVKQIDCDSNAINGPNYPQEPVKDPFSSKCSQVFTDMTFQITSPNYPRNYPENQNCVINVIKKTGGANICQIEVHFVDFSTNDDPNCGRDYVDFDGEKVCGVIPPEAIRFFPFDKAEFLIRFKTDYSGSERGFKINLRQRECLDGFSRAPSSTPPYRNLPPSMDKRIPESCNKMITSQEFELKSPQYPSFYDNNVDCSYVIRRTHRGICKLELRFVDFDVEEGNDCEFDYVQVDSKKHCGVYKSNYLSTVEFDGDQKVITFHSDPATSRRGFLILGQQKECDNMDSANHPSAAIAPSICELCFADVRGIIKSYNYPNSYPPNLNCKYRITAMSGYCSVHLKFDYFQLAEPRQNSCNEDYLEINDIRYCGKQLDEAIQYLSFEGSPKEINLRFVSRNYAPESNRGFRASYYQLPCSDGGNIVPAQSSNYEQPSRGVITTGSITVIENDHNKPTPQQYDDSSSNKLPRVPCDLVVYDMYFEITSPGYPYAYPLNADCLYSIRRVNANICKLKVMFLDFEVEASNECGSDYLEIDDRKICGSLSNSTIKEYEFRNYKLAMRFRTDERGSRKGFLIRGQQIDCTQSGYSQYAPAPYPSQPVSYQQYPATQARERYPPPGPVPMHPNIPPQFASPPASHGSYYPPEEQSRPSMVYSPAPRPIFNAPPSTYSQSFNSPAIYPPPPVPKYSSNYPSSPSISHCDQVITDGFFDIKTPSYPYRYSAGSQCTFTIKKFKHNVCHLDLMFITFDVGDNSCQRDFFSIDGERLCGIVTKEKIKTYRFDLPEKFLYFKGEVGQGLGFHIRGRQVECAQPNIESHHRRQDEAAQTSYSPQVSISVPFCDETHTGNEFTITSPNYPNDYPDNLYCRYSIKRPTANVCAIDMRFTSFDVEDDVKCSKDYVEIDSGRICGHLPPNHERRYYYFPQEYEKTITFRSDTVVGRSGFKIHFNQVTDCGTRSWKPAPSLTCDLNKQDVRGHITSVNYPNNYDDYMRCTYTIQAANAHYCTVRIYLRDTDIESSPACDKDYIFMKGERHCGSDLKQREFLIYFPEYGSREVQFSFHSDSSVNKRGFYAEYIQEPCLPPKYKQQEIHQNTRDGHAQHTHQKSDHPSSSTSRFHRAKSLSSPEYPANHVVRAQIEEIVETQVEVLDKRPNTGLKESSSEEISQKVDISKNT